MMSKMLTDILKQDTYRMKFCSVARWSHCYRRVGGEAVYGGAICHHLDRRRWNQKCSVNNTAFVFRRQKGWSNLWSRILWPAIWQNAEKLLKELQNKRRGICGYSAILCLSLQCPPTHDKSDSKWFDLGQLFRHEIVEFIFSSNTSRGDEELCDRLDFQTAEWEERIVKSVKCVKVEGHNVGKYLNSGEYSFLYFPVLFCFRTES